MEKFLSRLIENSSISTHEKPRNYIGASSIGSMCSRSVWYGFHKPVKLLIEPRRRRTFDVGKSLEGLVLDWLERSGLTISRSWVDLNDKNVFLFRGHVDGMILENDEAIAIIEIKTAKDSSFRVFEKKGLRLWYPVYYAQVQSYMGMSGVHKAYVIAINKDTSELHDECVSFDEVYYESLVAKAKSIIESPEEPPQKISQSPLYFACRMCDYRGICHG